MKMNIMEIVKAMILGIVQGLTEWLPISSTGHMILVDQFMQLHVTKQFMEVFLVVIQFGSILAVVFLFWNKLFPFGWKQEAGKRVPYIKMDIMELWFKVVVAALPAAVIGIPFDDKIDALFYNYQTVAITLILYGVLFIIVENGNRKRKFSVTQLSQLSYTTAFGIGIFQILSLIPGTSRSGSTIIGAMLLGVSRYVAAEFTFFLAIPIMFGASLLKIVKFGFAFQPFELVILFVGLFFAFVVSILAIRFLMGYIKKHDFKVFGYYRIILGIIVILYFLGKNVL